MAPSENRIENLRSALKNPTVDAFLITSEVNVSYLTGFSGDSSALIVTGRTQILSSDGRYTTQLSEECPRLEVYIRPVGKQQTSGMATVIDNLGAKTVGFEAHVMSVANLEALRTLLPTVSFVPLPPKVELLRMIKDQDELAAIKNSIAIAERAFAMLKPGINPADSEKDLADRLESTLRHCGAACSAFPPIVAVGPRAALPHAHPTPEARISDDDFVLIDWGATAGVHGRRYKSDLTRMVVTGKLTSKFEQVYETVLKAQERGIAAIRPGVSGRDVDFQARSVIDDAGFGRYFDHGLGHGFGLEIHESPRFHRDSDVILEPGMVVTVEPGIYLPGWGGVRIEDDVLVTPTGCEVLTSVPKTLESVRI